MITDYTQYITGQHIDKPKFVAMIALHGGIMDSLVQGSLDIMTNFDLDNAFGVQLDAIGLWVGQTRVVAGILDPSFFGFADDDAALPFGELTNVDIGGRFYEQGESFSSSATLGDPEYKTILRAKICKNQYKGDLAGLENALQFIFGVPCAVIDPGNWAISLQIGRPITAVEKTLLSTFDILPRPATVAISSFQYTQFIAGATVSTATVHGHL